MWYKIIRVKKENSSKKWIVALAIVGAVSAVLAAFAVFYKKYNNVCCCKSAGLTCDEEDGDLSVVDAEEEKETEEPECEEEDELSESDEENESL